MNNTVIKTENIAPKQRNASLDLLRVLAMLMIVMGHCIGHGGVSSALYGKTSFNYIIIETVNTFIHVHVNCFVLVSGYFLCTGKFKLSKWLQLWATALFWSVLLYVILSVTGNTGFSLKGLFRACLPFTNQRYWFLTTYLLMYMLSPICNIAIRSMDQKQHLTAIGAFFAVFICLQNVVYWQNFSAMDAYDPMYFIFLYFVAAYIRKYPFTKKYHWGIGYVLCMGFITAWKIFEPMISTKIFGYELGGSAFSAYNSVPMVLGAVCFFMMFLNLNVKGIVAKTAMLISPLTFGVYLIHDNTEMRNFLWYTLLNPYRYAQSPFIIFIVIGFSICIFVVCCCFEKARVIAFKCLKIDILINKVSVLFEKSVSRICEKIIS